MSKNDETERNVTTQQDARLPSTTRPNINEPAERDENASDTAKDINVVRGDDEPQAVRHSG